MAIINRHATIHDVAALAGVSISTVSKYVNGTKEFPAATSEKIRAAIETLGYQSNPLASSMKTGRTRNIGMATFDIRNPHYANIVRGANKIVQEKGFNLIFVDTKETLIDERNMIEDLSRRVDGMLVRSLAPEASLQWLTELGKPVVFFGNLTSLPLPCAYVDSYKASYLMAEHLVELGHRRVTFFGANGAIWNTERLRGARDCFKKIGLDVKVVESSLLTSAEGARQAEAVLLCPDRPDAIVCCNDLMAVGILHAAFKLGVKIPEEVSVVGFDNIHFSEYSTPALTTMDNQSENLGEQAMTMLLNYIAGKNHQDRLVFEPRMILRESTCRRN